MMSSAVILKEGKAIRGGIPVIFPQFGAGPLPQHGFARTSVWSIKEAKVVSPNEVWVTVELKEDEKTMKVWNNTFSLELQFKIYYSKETQSKLIIKFTAANSSNKEFTFTAALHTYFSVKDITKTSVSSLTGLEYLDKVKNLKAKEESPFVKFSGETDRIYYKAPKRVEIIEEEGKEHIYVEKENFGEVVVWNAWKEKAKAMEDLGDDDWKNYVCVEAAAVGEPITLKPKETWSAIQEIGTTPSSKL